MDTIQPTQQVMDEKNFEYHFNAISVDELFDHYKRVGFIYPQKKLRLAPFLNKVKLTWETALQAGPELFCLVSACDSEACHLATLTIWRTTNNGWFTQHLTSSGNPLNARAILLGTQSHALKENGYLSGQNWFQPSNKYANRIFGTITKTLSESYAEVKDYDYLAVNFNNVPKICSGAHIICCTERDASALNAFAERIRGRQYALAEELHESDIELEELNDRYRSVGLHRMRRSWLAFRAGQSEPVAGAIAYSGSLGMNFSFLENRCDLLCDPSLEDSMRANICTNLLYLAGQYQHSLPLRYLPVTTDHNTGAVLIECGARLIRSYRQSIWLREAFPSWLKHINTIFHRVEQRYLSRRASKAFGLTKE